MDPPPGHLRFVASTAVSTAPVPDIHQLEAELCRLPEVKAARVVADSSGALIEVHIVATPEKHPKQLVRDVQTVSFATFGVDVDRRIVSVVQLDDHSRMFEAAAPKLEVLATPEPRLRVAKVTVETSDDDTQVRVTVERGDQSGAGSSVGPPVASLLPRLAAEAALAAVRDLEPLAAPVAVEMASVSALGARRIAHVAVVCAAFSADEVLTGSAVVRNDDASAIARAVLDALNRRLPALR